MPKLTHVKTNFTAGEISPRLLARIDVARYNNGAETLLNAYPLVHGGARRRCGSRFTAAAKVAADTCRIAPFVFKRDQAFIVEFGDTYLRFFAGTGRIESAGTPIEVTSPWADDELADVKYVQRGDTMFLAHPDYDMRKLVRYSNTSWKLSTVDWEVPPSDEIGERPSTQLTVGALSGAGVTGQTVDDAFRLSDVGRYIEVGVGRGKIASFVDTKNITLDIDAADAFGALVNASETWMITESPKVKVTPSATGPVGETVTLTAAASAWKNFAENTHVGSFVEINDGLAEISGFTSATVVDAIVRVELSATTAAPSEGWALRQVQWNSLDGFPRSVGLYQQRLIVGGTTNFPNTVWGTRVAEYFNFAEGENDSDGFAFQLDSDQLDEIEHITSAKVLFPLTAGAEWSMFGGVEKPITPTNVQANDDTAYGCSKVRPVRVGNEVLFVEDGGKKVRAITYRVDNDSFNAPDISVLSEHVSGDGLTDMAFQKKPDSVVWMVREDGFLVSLSIDRDQEAIGFARHQTDGEFESIAVIPFNGTSQLWAVVKRTIDGADVRYIEVFEEGLQTDCALTGAVDENVITAATWLAGVLTLTRAAHGYATGATVRLSGFTSANGGIDDEYDITVTGVDTYTVPLAADPGAITVLGTDAQATVNWSGFDHLEGETIDIVADGYVAAQQTVTAGAIVLERAAYEIEGGQHYKTTIKTLPPEVGTGTGSAQGNAISIHEITVRWYKTKGGTVNGQPVLSRNFGTGAILNQPVPEFTGDKRVENLGWGRTGSGDSPGNITIEQDQPLPMQVLGVITNLTVNDG